MVVVYIALWLLTFVGVWSPEPRILNVPAWYWWVGFVVILLVPVNTYFVRRCWPEDSDA